MPGIVAGDEKRRDESEKNQKTINQTFLAFVLGHLV
jgi:hypothetical protein